MLHCTNFLHWIEQLVLEHGTHVPGPVSQSSAENEYNAACTAGMPSAHFKMLIHELLNKDPEIFPE